MTGFDPKRVEADIVSRKRPNRRTNNWDFMAVSFVEPWTRSVWWNALLRSDGTLTLFKKLPAATLVTALRARAMSN
jgi:hypothetical protein